MNETKCSLPWSLLWFSRQQRTNNFLGSDLTVMVKSGREPQDLLRGESVPGDSVIWSEAREESGEEAFGKKLVKEEELDRKWCDRGG